MEFSCTAELLHPSDGAGCSDVPDLSTSRLYQRLNEMRQKRVGCDVFFAIGQDSVEFPAHRVILAASSPVFSANFFGKVNSKDGLSDTLPMSIPDVNPEAFEIFLEYCYTDPDEQTFLIPTNLVVHLLYAAEKYDVVRLKQLCMKQIREGTSQNTIPILTQALQYGEKLITQKCLEIIDENCDELIRTHALQQCDKQTLLIIIDRDEFAPTSEYQLFKEIISYRKHQNGGPQNEDECTEANSSKDIRELLRSIRFPQMSVRELLDVAREGVLSNEELGELLSFMVGAAQSLRSFTTNPRRRPSEEHQHMCIRRIGRPNECAYTLRRHSGNETSVEAEWSPFGHALIFEANRNLLLTGFGVYTSQGRCLKECAGEEDVVVMFGVYGGNTMRIPVRTAQVKDDILSVTFAEGQMMLATKKYYLCANFHNAHHCILQRFTNYVESAVVETIDGTNVIFTFDALPGNTFFPELYFRI